MIKHFINLTNGIEFIPNIKEPYSFIRIQSTACEQKRWDFILQDLDYNFLMSLAVGEEVYVYDCGAHKEIPRAIYQGLEFVKFVLNKRWFDNAYIPIVRGHNCYQYFLEQYQQLNKKTKAKIDYFIKFLNCNQIKINVITSSTNHDSHYDYYNKILQQAI